MTKCIIVEDEPLAREILHSYISEEASLELVSICKNATEAAEALKNNIVDLIFLDINMPKTSGISFYKTLVNRPKVIFTTAYTEHAVEGFELEAIDYLLKPFSFERFSKALRKYHQDRGDAIDADFIMLKSDKKTHKINYDQISHIESIGDYVKVHLTEQNTLIISDTLRKLEKVLPPSFLRIHKSFIISIEKLEYIEGNQIKLGKVKIPIGQSYREKVNKVFKR